jgi:hypothetical protein
MSLFSEPWFIHIHFTSKTFIDDKQEIPGGSRLRLDL